MQISEADEVFPIDDFEKKQTEASAFKGFERFVMIPQISYKRNPPRSRSLGKLGGLVKQVRMPKCETKPDFLDKTSDPSIKNNSQVRKKEESVGKRHKTQLEDYEPSQGSQIYFEV